MSMPQDVATNENEFIVDPAASEPSQAQVGTQEQGGKTAEVAVEITGIKASGLPAKVGLFSGLFYVRVKGGKVPQRTKTTKYIKGDEFVATWGDTVKLSGLESSKVEIEVFARRFFFSYKVIKKTESKESLADLLEHADSPIELELLEEGQAAGKLTFKISKSAGGNARDQVPPAPTDASSPDPDTDPALPASAPGSPRQTA